jgi:hypothetical protein
MRAKAARSSLCWFGATCFAIIALFLVLAAVDISATPGWSLTGILLLILAAGALVLTGLLMALAFRLERRSGGST